MGSSVIRLGKRPEVVALGLTAPPASTLTHGDDVAAQVWELRFED